MGPGGIEALFLGRHFLVADDARLRDPREHEALRETELVHPGHVPCSVERATQHEREDPGSLLGALPSEAVDVRL